MNELSEFLPYHAMNLRPATASILGRIHQELRCRIASHELASPTAPAGIRLHMHWRGCCGLLSARQHFLESAIVQHRSDTVPRQSTVVASSDVRALDPNARRTCA